MNSELISSILRASLIAAIPFGIWIWLYFNPKKTWFFRTSTNAVVFGVIRFWYYVAPFLGVAFLFFGIDDYFLGLNPYTGSIWFFVGLGSIAIGFVCGFIQPNWLSPPWLRRLRREYGDDVIDLLIEDAIGMDKYDLEQRLETKEAMEQWIAEVQSKDGV